MPRFFLENIHGKTAILQGEDARHITRSLRMEPGEKLTLCDMQGWDYHCEIERAEGDMVHVQILEKVRCVNEAPCNIRLYQAMPKNDKLEFIIQKATELGATEIVPVITARCISRPHIRSMEKKRVRMQKIAAEAAKQSGRGMIPRIEPMITFSEAVGQMSGSPLPILFYEESDTPLRSFLGGEAPEEIALMIGSEGGFTVKEVEEAREAGIRIASLGRRILRCETAPVCALSVILYFLGEF